MKKLPKISVITITYNSEKLLERAVRSVIDQDYPELEYIIVDGGSTDGTIEIIKKYEDRISKWVSEPDNGISDAFNKGIRMASGDIIGITNSDDGLLPGALAAVADAFEDDIDVYRRNVMLWQEDKNTRVIEKPTMKFRFNRLYSICHQSTFVTKKAYEKYGVFNVSLKYTMDYDLLLRFQNSGAKSKHIDKTLAFYSLGGACINSDKKKLSDEVAKVMKLNGATKLQIAEYRFFRSIKHTIQKIVPKEVILKIRHGKNKNITA